MRAFPLLAVAALALAAGACAAPPAQTSAGEAVSGPGSGNGEHATARAGQSWWQRITKDDRKPGEKPWVYGAVRPGKGLLSDDGDGFVLHRQGEGDSSDDSTKPTKVRR